MRKTFISKIALACTLTCGLVATSAVAQDKPIAPTVGPAVTSMSTPAASPAPAKGVFSMTANYSYSDQDTWFNNGTAHSTDKRVVANVVALKFRYGLGDKWDVRTVTPVFWLDIDGKPQNKEGIGDSSIVFRKLFMDQADGDPLNLSYGFGFVIPTGDTGADGFGKGAFGLHGEVGATYAFDNNRQVVEGGLLYIWAGDGSGKEHRGDQADNFRAHARYVYALDEQWSLGLETVYNYYSEFEVDHHFKDNAKHQWFAGPAVTYKIPAWKVVLGASVQAPLYVDINPDGGLGEKCCFEFKFMKVF